MPVDFKHVKKQFERSMSDYNKNAIVQDVMAGRMMFNLLKISREYENILEIGTGTGLLTKYIAKDLKYKYYCGNDIIEKSKNYIKKFIPETDFICGNAIKIKPEKKFDLIIANAVFQWFENTEKIISKLKSSLKENGFLAFSTFSPENFHEITEIAGLSLKYTPKEKICQILNTYGFEILYSEEFNKIIEFNTPLEMLVHLKKTGVNSLSDRVWSIKHVKHFCDKYSEKYPQTILTYSPIIIIARLNTNPVKPSDN